MLSATGKSSTNRVLYALLLVLFVSHALNGVHAATHIDADPGECALCASHASASPAPADSGSFSIPSASAGRSIDIPQLDFTAAPVLCNYQRGPPQTESG